MSARPRNRRPAAHGAGESARNARLRAQAAAQAAAARRRRLRVLGAVVALGVLVVVLGIVVGPRLTGSSSGSSAPLEAPVTVAPAQRSPQPPSAGEPVVLAGDEGADHVLTVWADFSCPHCRDFATDYHGVLERAAGQGQVRVELMPLTFVEPASSVPAANAFACAAEAGFGAAFHDALFASFRTDWDVEQLVALAEQVSPPAGEDFAACLRDSRHQPYLDSVDQAAQAAGVDATPTVLLDGAPLELAQTTPADLATTLQETP